MISVVVPVYNVEKYLRRCLDSILAQSYKDYELILVDDGSTDNSGKILGEWRCENELENVSKLEAAGLGASCNSI